MSTFASQARAGTGANYQQWEYAMIGPFKHDGRMVGHFPKLFRYTSDGIEEQEIPHSGGSPQQYQVAARLIAQLGMDGWEMSGCGNVGQNLHVIYFKRPRQPA